MSKVPYQKRRRLILISRAVWIPGLVVAAPFFFLNAYITATGVYCCGTPWDNVSWMPLIGIFLVAMTAVLTGLLMRRVVARASTGHNLLWLAIGIGWIGTLSFGVGSAGGSYYVDSASGVGEVMCYMSVLGMLAIVIAVVVAISGLAGARRPTADHRKASNE